MLQAAMIALIVAVTAAIIQISQPKDPATQVGLYVGIVVGVLTFIGMIVAAIRWCIRRLRQRRKYFRVVWRKSSKLKRGDLLDPARPYEAYYYSRPQDQRIERLLEAGESLLIKAPPLGGKTRAAFEALRDLETPVSVTVAEAGRDD